VAVGYREDDNLPEGVYEVPGAYALERFGLGDVGEGALAELARLGIPRDDVEVRFGTEALESAQQLGAGHADR